MSGTNVQGAFKHKIWSSDELLLRDAPVFHIVPYISGGLRRLYYLLKTDSVPQLFDYGYHTNSEGHFDPKPGCLMGLRFQVKDVLDSLGNSSTVVLAEDVFCGNKPVVIKVLHAQYYELGVQEGHVLSQLARADPLNLSHTLRLQNTLTFDGHYCLVFEPLIPESLTSVFRRVPKHRLLDNIRKVGIRLLAAVGFLHQQNFIHTDLKPDNILLKYKDDLDSVHVVDFGNALRNVHSEVSIFYNDFELQTPLYRAPEVVFGVPFGQEIDMWSLGCVLAELYLGKLLFYAAKIPDILTQVTELLGPVPAKHFLRGKYYKTYERFTADNTDCNATLRLLDHLQCKDVTFANLIAGLLKYNPEERLKPHEAARHPFFASYLPLAFLMPPTKGKQASYGAVSLDSEMYTYRPKIAPDKRKRQLTSVELLHMGTSELSPLDALPVQGTSPRHSSVQSVEKTSCSNNADNTAACVQESKYKCRGSTDMWVVRSVEQGTGNRKLQENVKDKMSKLLDAIRYEQSIAEEDLEQQSACSQVGRDMLKQPIRPCPVYRQTHDRKYNDTNSDKSSLLKSPGQYEKMSVESKEPVINAERLDGHCSHFGIRKQPVSVKYENFERECDYRTSCGDAIHKMNIKLPDKKSIVSGDTYSLTEGPFVKKNKVDTGYKCCETAKSPVDFKDTLTACQREKDRPYESRDNNSFTETSFLQERKKLQRDDNYCKMSTSGEISGNRTPTSHQREKTVALCYSDRKCNHQVHATNIVSQDSPTRFQNDVLPEIVAKDCYPGKVSSSGRKSSSFWKLKNIESNGLSRSPGTMTDGGGVVETKGCFLESTNPVCAARVISSNRGLTQEVIAKGLNKPGTKNHFRGVNSEGHLRNCDVSSRTESMNGDRIDRRSGLNEKTCCSRKRGASESPDSLIELLSPGQATSFNKVVRAEKDASPLTPSDKCILNGIMGQGQRSEDFSDSLCRKHPKSCARYSSGKMTFSGHWMSNNISEVKPGSKMVSEDKDGQQRRVFSCSHVPEPSPSVESREQPLKRKRNEADCSFGILPTPIHKYDGQDDISYLSDSPEIVYKGLGKEHSLRKESGMQRGTSKSRHSFDEEFGHGRVVRKNIIKEFCQSQQCGKRLEENFTGREESGNRENQISKGSEARLEKPKSRCCTESGCLVGAHGNKMNSNCIYMHCTENCKDILSFQRDKFAFRDTPTTDIKHIVAKSSLAKRIEQREKRLKKRARKSLTFTPEATVVDSDGEICELADLQSLQSFEEYSNCGRRSKDHVQATDRLPVANNMYNFQHYSPRSHSQRQENVETVERRQSKEFRRELVRHETMIVKEMVERTQEKYTRRNRQEDCITNVHGNSSNSNCVMPKKKKFVSEDVDDVKCRNFRKDKIGHEYVVQNDHRETVRQRRSRYSKKYLKHPEIEKNSKSNFRRKSGFDMNSTYVIDFESPLRDNGGVV